MTVLARLTAGTTTKDPREGPGGHNALTEADINFAVSTLSPMDAAILLASHINQPPPPEQFLQILDYLNKQVMQREWQKLRLGKVDLDQLDTMAEIAWAEFCTGERMSEEQKALECDMTPRTWRDKYRLVYPAATGELSFRERRAYGRVKGALK